MALFLFHLALLIQLAAIWLTLTTTTCGTSRTREAHSPRRQISQQSQMGDRRRRNKIDAKAGGFHGIRTTLPQKRGYREEHQHDFARANQTAAREPEPLQWYTGGEQLGLCTSINSGCENAGSKNSSTLSVHFVFSFPIISFTSNSVSAILASNSLS